MKTVEQYIDEVTPNLIPIVFKLREIIKSVLPKITEKISYDIPFYYYEGPLCYINAKPKYVDLDFVKGSSLSNKQGTLNKENRKQVASLQFSSESAIDTSLIKEILIEAAIFNEIQALTKKR